jgi:hypothetical protein
MTVAVANRNVSVGTIGAIAGGALALIGAFLAWETVSADLAAFTGEGTDLSGWSIGNGGKILAVLGIVAMALGGLALLDVKLPFSSAAAVTAVGVLGLLVAMLNYGSVVDDVNGANLFLDNAAGIGMGLYLDIVAAVVILTGGILGLVVKKR